MKAPYLVPLVIFASTSSLASEVTLNFFGDSGAFLTAPYYESGVRVTSLSGHYDFFGSGLNIDPIVRDSASLVDSRVRIDMYGAWFDPGKLTVASTWGAGALLTSSKGGVIELSSAGTYTPSGDKWKNVEWVEFSVKAPPTTDIELPTALISSMNLGFEQGVYLDFGSAPSRGIETVKTVTKQGSLTVHRWSDSPTSLGRTAAAFSQAQIDAITSQVRDIFNKSGTPVPIFAKTSEFLDAWFDLPSSALAKVKFGSAVPGLLGKAAMVDQFNKGKDGEVAVFLDPASTKVATVVAHEVGHILGVMHVNPKTTNDEVEDYGFGSTERFTDFVTPVRVTGKGPVNGNNVDLKFSDGAIVTHNPSYHLKKYSLGATENLGDPGTYDIRAFKSYKASLEIDLVADVGVDSFVVVSADGAEFSGEAFGEFFEGSVNGKAKLTWQGLEGGKFEIFGRKDGADDYEISFFFGDSSSFDFESTNGAVTLQFYDRSTETYRVVGTGLLAITMAPAVPEVEAMMMAVFGLFTMMTCRLRSIRKNAVKVHG